MRIRVITLKPQTDQVEYGVTTEAASETPTASLDPQVDWTVHGLVIPFVLNSDTTGAEVIAAAQADAVARGIITA